MAALIFPPAAAPTELVATPFGAFFTLFILMEKALQNFHNETFLSLIAKVSF
jgi:hypothetical protein